MNECSTTTSSTDPSAAKEVVVSTPTLTMMKAAVAAGEDGMHTDANQITGDDNVQVAAWATRQLASPVHLQGLRVVYDKLVDRLDPQHPRPQRQQRRMTRSLHLTCRLLLEIHRAGELDPTSTSTSTDTTGTVQRERQQQQLLTTSQQHSIETTEQRCRWLIDHDHPVFHNILAATATAVPSVAGGSDNQNVDKRRRLTPENPDIKDADDNSSDQGDDSEITNLCRRICHTNPDCTISPDTTIQSTEWTYVLARRNDNKSDNDQEDEEEDDGALPSQAELAAEEQMLWRMADTPIPS
jgi:hypothetical protein